MSVATHPTEAAPAEAAAAEAAVSVRGISKTYGEVEALRNLSLEFPRGQLTSMLGPSGCGKTTLLEIIAGLLAPTAGEVEVNGRPVTGPGPDRAFVFQDFALLPWATGAAQRRLRAGAARRRGVGARGDRGALHPQRRSGMSSLILWGLAWEAVGWSGLTFFLPPLSDVIATFFAIAGTAAFQKALSETAQAFLAGVLSAVAIGIPVGILMGKSRLIDELLLPWVNIFLSAPLTALVPVLMVLFGFGMKSIIITTALFAVWIVILNARAGVMQINRSLVEMARSFGATPWAAFTKVYFGAALPEILGGVRIGVIRAVKGVIIGQLLISIVGFGALFELYSANFLMSHFWAVPCWSCCSRSPSPSPRPSRRWSGAFRTMPRSGRRHGVGVSVTGCNASRRETTGDYGRRSCATNEHSGMRRTGCAARDT